jgi:hypothetical protein
LIYDDYDLFTDVGDYSYRACPEMQAHRLAVMKLLYSFNNENLTDCYTIETLLLNRMEIARNLLGSVGEGVKIEAPFFSAFGCNTFIGDGVYINRESVSNAKIQFQIP